MQINKVYIDRQVSDDPVVDYICNRIPAPSIIADGPEAVYEIILKADDPIRCGKRSLFLTRNKGAFIRKCPGTAYYICCGYRILHVGTYCTMDCTYCILQSYFHPPLLQFYVNHQDLIKSLDVVFSINKIMRIGTGEYTDSLIWEKIYPFSEKLILKFADQSHVILELKTKTTHIDKLLNLKHNRKTILSWSLNTEKIIKTSENGTTSLVARLKAAAKCQASGYPLGFHFDPIIVYPDCENDYQQVVKKLFQYVSPGNIVWISLGTFRFMPDLKSIIEKRFNRSSIVYGEFIKGLDGKMRYFKPLRIQVYRKIISAIRFYAPDVLIYFCMEDDEVWQTALGFSPSEFGGLPIMLDQSAVQHCDLG